MFLIIYTYKKPLAVVDQFLVEHRAYLDSCYKNNQLIVSGPKQPRVGAVLLSQLSNEEQLKLILKNDPFVINEIVDYEITEFIPVKYHEQFVHFLDIKL